MSKKSLFDFLDDDNRKRRYYYIIVSITTVLGTAAALSVLLYREKAEINETRLLPLLIMMSATMATLAFVYLTAKTRLREKTSETTNDSTKEKVFQTTVEKLEFYISNLRNAGNLYLSVGSMLTLMAAGFLIVTLLKKQEPTDVSLLLQYYMPRITIGLLIEVFAFYFLKLFKENLRRIQHYQNEVITLETKYVALKEAKDLITTNPEILTMVLTEFAKTERNKGFAAESGGISDKDALDAIVKLVKT